MILLSSILTATLTLLEPTKPFELSYDYNTITPVRLYLDGELFKEYSTNEITFLTKTTQSSFPNTYILTVPPLNRQAATLTITTLISDGTNLFPSANAEPLNLEFHPRAPEMLQTLDLVNDQFAISRIVVENLILALKHHPEWRPEIESTWSRLDVLSHANKIDVPTVLVIIKHFPENEMTGEAKLLLKQFERGDAVNPRAVILSIINGIKNILTAEPK